MSSGDSSRSRPEVCHAALTSARIATALGATGGTQVVPATDGAEGATMITDTFADDAAADVAAEAAPLEDEPSALDDGGGPFVGGGGLAAATPATASAPGMNALGAQWPPRARRSKGTGTSSETCHRTTAPSRPPQRTTPPASEKPSEPRAEPMAPPAHSISSSSSSSRRKTPSSRGSLQVGDAWAFSAAR